MAKRRSTKELRGWRAENEKRKRAGVSPAEWRERERYVERMRRQTFDAEYGVDQRFR